MAECPSDLEKKKKNLTQTKNQLLKSNDIK